MTAIFYQTLKARFERIGKLKAAETSLFWDSRTMLAPASGAGRGHVVAELRAMQHEIFADPDTALMLETIEAGAQSLGDWDRANLQEMRRLWRAQALLDPSLVRAIAEAGSRAQSAWAEARQANDFKIFEAAMAPMLALQREAAETRKQGGQTLYDVFLDDWEAGLTQNMVDTLFSDLEAFLPPLVAQASAANKAKPIPLPLIARDVQHGMCERLLGKLGYDFSSGRLDPTVHPFAMAGVPGDYRVTTRYDESNALFAVMAAVHEMGHSFYEAGLPAEWHYQPVGNARGGAIHESQSLLFEMQAARSSRFLRYLAGPLSDAAGRHPALEADNLVALNRNVSPGEIRVGADEVTYPLHVILRYRIECALLDGSLALADLPGAWNDLSRSLLGVVPRDDVHGCLQDMHWSIGLFGYFPTYTFGAVIAAQMFAAFETADPEGAAAIGAGDFSALHCWTGQNVHRLASLYSAPNVVEQATGQPLSKEAFKRHLLKRYAGA